MDEINKKELEALRLKIDQIDDTLLELFEQRMLTVMKIAAYKKKNQLKILDESREKKILEKAHTVKTPTLIEPSASFMKTLMNISRDLQTEINDNPEQALINDNRPSTQKNLDGIVGFQGLPGSYSEQALFEYFGEYVQTKNVVNFEDVFQALQSGEISYGVLPIENSFTGGIADVYDLLCKYGFFIIGEKSLHVDHNLMVKKGTKLEDIKEICSHPQGLQQCSHYLQSYPQWNRITCSNTAVSAKFVADSPSTDIAAIASKRAAILYGLDILAAGITNNASNFTRFIIIGTEMEPCQECNKISLAVAIKHEPGSLYCILSHFAEKGLNMLKIESRPIADKPWEYLFYIDFEGNLCNPSVKDAVDKIKESSAFFQMLGNYAASR